ncbi:MAG TPA: response regulator [Nitrospiraceae bacterium]|nr:response regulator [Nitrospiraceae bacterium]
MSKIVVVDDSQADLKLIEEYLKSAHHTVVSFSDAINLEDKLVKEKPDVVVMDVVMPGRNGFQVCRDLKNDERYKNVPVILCTSKAQESDKFWGKQQGANGYLVKPVKAEALLDAIKAALQ